MDTKAIEKIATFIALLVAFGVIGWLMVIPIEIIFVLTLASWFFIEYSNKIVDYVFKRDAKYKDLSIKAFSFLKKWWEDSLGTGDNLVYHMAIFREFMENGERCIGFNVPSKSFRTRLLAIVGLEPMRIKYLNLVKPNSFEDPVVLYKAAVEEGNIPYFDIDRIRRELRYYNRQYREPQKQEEEEI